MKILIIEDSAFQRKLIIDALHTLSLEISEAASAEEAVDILKTSKFSLILLDLLLPHMDGIEFLKQYGNLLEKTPVLVLTADIQETTKNECLRLGAQIFINKPFQKEELLNTVKKFLPLQLNL